MTRVWLNGDWVDEERARISIHDRGFTLGDGLFETMRAYGGRVFRLADHLDRLRRAADRIELALPDRLSGAVTEILTVNGLSEAAVRLTLTRGPAPGGLAPPEEPEPTCLITARPAPERPPPLRVGLATGRINERAATTGLKRIGYLDAVMALREARSAGWDDAIFLDSVGHLAEGTASNLFLVVDGVLFTPPVSCGILPGITRAVVCEMASQLGWAVQEEALEPMRLSEAEEIFLTSSLREIAPVVSVGGRPVSEAVPGPVTRTIQRAYGDLVRAPDTA